MFGERAPGCEFQPVQSMTSNSYRKKISRERRQHAWQNWHCEKSIYNLSYMCVCSVCLRRLSANSGAAGRLLTLATRQRKAMLWRLAGVDEICGPVNNSPHGGIMLAWNNVPTPWLYASQNRARLVAFKRLPIGGISSSETALFGTPYNILPRVFILCLSPRDINTC